MKYLLLFCVAIIGVSVASFFNAPGLLVFFIFSATLVLSLAWHSAINPRLWRQKQAAGMAIALSGCAILHNAALYSDWLPEGLAAGASVATIIGAVFIAYRYLSTYYNRLPKADIIPGKFYEVIGEPTNKWQMVSHYLGRGGSHLATNGIHIWKYSIKTGNLIKREWTESDTEGKACIEIEGDPEKIAAALDGGVGRKWTWRRSCLSLTRGIK